MENYDDIRPYSDAEVPAAMQRITQTDAFPLLAKWIFPESGLEEVRLKMLSFQTVHDFQYCVMKTAIEQIMSRSITSFTFDGCSQLRPDTQYLFVSNHRDIMLDAALLQYVMASQGRETTEITFGSNLMSPGLVTDIGKCNKMFRVERGGPMRDFYQSSLHVSQYIRYTLLQKRQSVWIAQRNGRTKNGSDHTDQGIIKMFCLSMPDDKIRALAELHIIPVSISYEWESCDVLKAIELYESRDQKYIKKPGEDLNSIITGILRPKGHVHMTLCPEVTVDDLMAFNSFTRNEYHKKVAELLDSRILAAYKLWPNNFIAHDMRYGQHKYVDRYTQDEFLKFKHHLKVLENYDTDDPELFRDIFLGIYSNPVDNCLREYK